MTLVQHAITQDVIERQYVYRYAWSSTLLLLVIGGLGTIGMAMAVSTQRSIWPWLLFTVAFFLVFLLGASATFVNIRGNLKFMISRNGVYIPVVWKFDRHTFIPFSRITAVEFLETQGNVIIQLCVGDEKYSIVHSWFPSQADFQEIIRTIEERLPDHVKQSLE